MKKSILILMLSLLSLGTVVANESPIQADASLFVSYGSFDVEDSSLALFAALYTIRGGFTGTARYLINDAISASAEFGLGYMSPDDYTTYIDVFANFGARFGASFAFVEPHAGYYLALDNEYLSGVSLGAKFLLGSWYLDLSQILSEIGYTRVTIGYQFNNLL